VIRVVPDIEPPAAIHLTVEWRVAGAPATVRTSEVTL
jgi:hypothetical protein